MGGNALAGLRHTRRFAAEEYEAMIPEVLARVRAVVGPANRAAVIPAYRAKESHGDMDVLVEVTDGSAYEFRQALSRAFGIDYLVANGTSFNQLEVAEDMPQTIRTAQELAESGKTYSFAFRELQVDILPTTRESFGPSLAYYSYSDCGNLLGRVVHSLGMKLGHLGLLYPFKSGDYEFTSLVVERDWKRILPAFGWKYETWAAGFETLEDMFAFVASTPFFNSDTYQFHNLNARSRVRDRKRTSYKGFLAWLQQQPPGSLPAYPSRAPEENLEMLFERLESSDFRATYDRTAQAFADWNRARRRFNGEVVRQLTGLDGRELAGVMTRVRAAMGATPEAIQAWVLSRSEAELVQLIQRTHLEAPAGATVVE